MSSAITAMDKSGSFRVYLTVSTDMVQTACDIHETTPLASAGLGRVLTAAGLMGIMMKNPTDKLTLIFKGDGPAKQILATAYGNGNVKGYIANPYIQLPLKENGKLDVGGSLGNGELTVIRDLGLKEPYSGTTALVSGEIAEDLTAYLYISEQQNSSVALGVKVEKDLSIGAAGGMIIQMLPDAREGSVDELEKIIGRMEPITTVISRASSVLTDTSEVSDESGDEKLLRAVLDDIFSGISEEYALEVLDIRDINWHCDCSRQRLEEALMTIGRKDMQEIIEEDGQAELQCQFCRKKYLFSEKELRAMFERM